MRIHLVFALLISVFLASANAQNTTLTFASQDNPPFNQDQDGHAIGPFADIIKLVCQRIQTDCVIETLPWRRVAAEVNQGRLSGQFPLVRYPEREQEFYLIGPVFYTYYAVYAGAGNTFQFHQAKDLEGYTIGVFGPSGTLKILERTTVGISPVKIEMEINNLTVLKKLSVGRYGPKGLGFINRDIAQYLISREHVANVHAVEEAQREGYYIGLSRKAVSADVAAKFTQALTAIKQSGEFAAILKKYGLEPTPEKTIK